MFLEQYWGGPTTYSEQRGHPRLRMRHHPFKVTPAQRDRWLQHMMAAVDTLDLAPANDLLLRDYLERAAHSMVNSLDEADATAPAPREPRGSAAGILPSASKLRSGFVHAADACRMVSRDRLHPPPRPTRPPRRSRAPRPHRRLGRRRLVAPRGDLPDLPALVGRRQRRRHRRPARHHRPPALPARPRRRRGLASPVLHVAAGRRRLRRRRLPRHRPALRHPRRRRRDGRQGPRARPQGDRRPGAQPHLRRARVVPGRAGRRARQPRARPLHLPRRQGRARRAAAEQLGLASSAAPAGPASPRPTARPASGTCTCSTPSSPTSTGTTPRSATSSCTSCGSGSTAASTASGSTSPTAWSRRRACPTDDAEALLGNLDGERRSPATPRPPMWDQDGVHEVYRAGASRARRATARRDRILCAEAWVQPAGARGPLRARRRDAPGVQLRLPGGASGRAADLRAVIESSLAANDAVGAPTTWVLSNHDVVRHASRLGLPVGTRRPNGIGAGDPQPDAELGLRRARAATALMLALPGAPTSTRARSSACPTPPTCPTTTARTRRFERSGRTERGRDGCRVPMPWEADAPSLGFGPSDQTWLPQPASYARPGRGPAGRRRGLDPRALPRAAAPPVA